ncbi:MAG: hypothetical protein J6Q54_03010 [Oscillospiraceae bacterium]|nr:hypothetical protein [Oscillospiraceae bacterium]
MAWCAYYVNDALLNKNTCQEEPFCFYDSHIPPHGSIRREWIYRGLKHGTAQITFTEYRLEDDDPDGVWEAYGQKRESEYSFTLDAQLADPEKLFVYALYKDGTLHTGFDIDPEEAVAILTFPCPQTITGEKLASLWEQVKAAPKARGAVEELVIQQLLEGKTHIPCLAWFQR